MRWLLVFLAAAALMAAASCGGGGESPPSGTSQVSGALTDDEVQKLQDIVRDDPSLAGIARGAQFTLAEIGRWSAGTVPETGEEIFAGATATMVLSQPFGHIQLDLPVATIRTYYASWSPEDRAKYTPYKEGTARFAIDNLSRLHLNVDLDRAKLAGIRVQPEKDVGQRVAVVPFEPAPVTAAGVSQVATDILNADPRLTALLSGRAHELTEGSTYSIANAHFAARAVHFDAIQTLEADWQILFEFDQATGAYESQTIHFKAAEVESVSAVIDLDKGEIAWLEPIRKKAEATATP